ncbi:hypothetical protein [uncultured Gammaproteobacteria bacterium]|nr:hypothetical protein [uncultured Gammaproteobacteria bacterium]
MVISLNLVLAGLRLGLKNRQVGEKWVSDDCSYLCKGLIVLCSVAFVCFGELVKGVVVVPMLFKTSRLPLASNSLVDCWVSVPRLLLGWMVRVCCQLPLLA